MASMSKLLETVSRRYGGGDLPGAEQASANADLCCDLGVACAAGGRFWEAVTHLREALRRKPDHAGAHYNLGVVFADRGCFAAAIDHYQQVLQLKPGCVTGSSVYADRDPTSRPMLGFTFSRAGADLFGTLTRFATRAHTAAPGEASRPQRDSLSESRSPSCATRPPPSCTCHAEALQILCSI